MSEDIGVLHRVIPGACRAKSNGEYAMLVPESNFALCGTQADITPRPLQLEGLEMTDMEAEELITLVRGIHGDVSKVEEQLIEVGSNVTRLSVVSEQIIPEVKSIGARLSKVEVELAEIRGSNKGKAGLVAMAAAIAGLIATAASFLK